MLASAALRVPVRRGRRAAERSRAQAGTGREGGISDQEADRLVAQVEEERRRRLQAAGQALEPPTDMEPGSDVSALEE